MPPRSKVKKNKNPAAARSSQDEVEKGSPDVQDKSSQESASQDKPSQPGGVQLLDMPILVPDKPTGQVPDKPTGQVQDKPTGQVQDKPTGQVQDKPTGQVQDKPTGQVQVFLNL